MNQLLKETYYDDKTGFTGLLKFYKRAKEKDPNVTLSDVKAYLDKQYTHQINRDDVRPKTYRTILANNVRDNYQMDLMVYNRFEKDGYKYILTCVDVNSRYAVAVPLKSRETDSLLKAIKRIFKEMGIPKNLNCDQEFVKSTVIKDYLTYKGIKLHVSDTDEINKNSIVERFHRTLALLLKRWRDGTKKKDWYNVLDSLIDNYNTSYHRTIKTEPKKVWEGTDENHQSPIYTLESEIGIGDLVRVKQLKSIFGKGDALKYSKEVYTVVEMKLGKEKKYKLEDVKTRKILDKPRLWFKDYELKKVSSIVETSGDIVEEDEEEPRQTRKQKKALKELETNALYNGVVEGKRQRKLTDFSDYVLT